VVRGADFATQSGRPDAPGSLVVKTKELIRDTSERRLRAHQQLWAPERLPEEVYQTKHFPFVTVVVDCRCLENKP
jgi:hypothetical protein